MLSRSKHAWRFARLLAASHSLNYCSKGCQALISSAGQQCQAQPSADPILLLTGSSLTSQEVPATAQLLPPQEELISAVGQQCQAQPSADPIPLLTGSSLTSAEVPAAPQLLPPQEVPQPTRGFASTTEKTEKLWQPKLLTKAIRRCQSSKKLGTLIQAHRQGFNHVHCAAAMVQFARVYRECLPGAARHGLKASAGLAALEQRIAGLLPCFGARELANVWHSFGVMWRLPAPELLQPLTDAVACQLPAFKPQELANTLWGFSRLQYYPGPELLQKMAAETALKLPGMQPQGLSITLCALAKLHHHPGAPILERMAEEVSRKLAMFSPQEIANTLWALAVLRHQLRADVLERMAEGVSGKLLDLRPVEVANTLWAFAKLHYRPQPSFMDELVNSAELALPGMSAQEASSAVWGVGRLKPTRVPFGLLDGACSLFEACAEALNDVELNQFMLGLAHLPYKPSRAVVAAAAREMVGRMGRLNHQLVSNMSWCFAKFGMDPGSEFWDALCKYIPGRADGFNAQAVSNLLWAAAKLRHPLDAEAIEALLQRAYVILPEFNEQDLWNTAQSLVKLQWCPAPAFLAELSAEADAKAQTFSPHGLAFMLGSLIRLGEQPTVALLDAAQDMLERGESTTGEELSEQHYEILIRVLEAYSDN